MLHVGTPHCLLPHRHAFPVLFFLFFLFVLTWTSPEPHCSHANGTLYLQMSWLDGVTEVREKLWGAETEVGLPACSEMKTNKQILKSGVGVHSNHLQGATQLSFYSRYSRASCKKVTTVKWEKGLIASSLEKQWSEQMCFTPRSNADISGVEPASCQTLHRTIAQEMSNATIIRIIRWKCV